jgi:CheY-like chemotaxis protein
VIEEYSIAYSMTAETKKENGKKKILVVDDEPDVLTLLKKVLKENGLKADSHDDPILALENFKAGLYDLLLSDIKMPKMDGLHFQGKEKDRQLDCGVFLTSSEMYCEKSRKEKEFASLYKDLVVRNPFDMKA